MYFKTFDEYDKSITQRMAKADGAVLEAFLQLKYMFELQEGLWKAEIKRLEIKGGWASLMNHKKDRWGITVQRFNRFRNGLTRIHDVQGESYKNTARKIGVDAVCLLGTPRFRPTMISKGLEFLQTNSRREGGAKVTFQYLTTYLRSQFPHAFMVRHKKCCPTCGGKLKAKQVLKTTKPKRSKKD